MARRATLATKSKEAVTFAVRSPVAESSRGGSVEITTIGRCTHEIDINPRARLALWVTRHPIPRSSRTTVVTLHL